jgi:aldose 1-epimerase
MLTLSRGDDSLVVAPEFGAAILGWTRRGAHLLRHPSPGAVLRGVPGEMGCFPLLPYCNRVAFGRFVWRGQTHELAPNFGDHPHAIHGVGWRSPWKIENASADGVTLSLRHDPIGPAALAWPYAFSARLAYRLGVSGLDVTIEVTNLDLAPSPAGIGLHPYFRRDAETSIEFRATGVWTARDSLPSVHSLIPPAWDHVGGRSADAEPLDHCFTGWNGTACLPRMRIEADKVFGCLHVFTPAGANFCCVEPVSHSPDAINRPDLPHTQAMTVLASGQTLRGSIRLSPDDAPRSVQNV